MVDVIRVGNAQGFWGDRVTAPATLMAKQPNLDYLTLDYLAEVTMSVLAMQKERDPSLGYATDFVDAVCSLIPFWKNDAPVKVVANAGGLNPKGCARALATALRKHGCPPKKIGVIIGDDVLTLIKRGGDYSHFDTGESIHTVQDRLVSANAYLGATPIIEALQRGADIVITGRVADPSLTVACSAYHYKWMENEWDKLAGATIAGHLIECGTQVTGGISTNWLDVPNPADIGFPIAEIDPEGNCVITKPLNTGGCVNEQTVKEQLLYEIGDPDHYLSPDVTVSFLSLSVTNDGEDRVRVAGAEGRPPPDTYKISATYREGFAAHGMLTLFGRHVQRKAYRCAEMVLDRVRGLGYDLERTHVECIGGGDVVPGVMKPTPEWDLKECVLRISVADPRKEAVECFTKELVPLVTSGSQGVTGYFSGRPKVRTQFGFWPCAICKGSVSHQVETMEV